MGRIMKKAREDGVSESGINDGLVQQGMQVIAMDGKLTLA